MTQANGDDSNDPDRKRGSEIRAARAQRVRTIRRTVLAGAVALFLATWMLIAVVLVSGHDPALARKTATVASVSGGTTTTSSSSSSGDSGTASLGSSSTAGSGTTASTGTSSAGSSVSSVTTQQS
jgi:hypothetical protein